MELLRPDNICVLTFNITLRVLKIYCAKIAFLNTKQEILGRQMMNDNIKRIEEIKKKIAELKKRWPAHSVSPALLMELDDLEDELEEALKELHREENDA